MLNLKGKRIIPVLMLISLLLISCTDQHISKGTTTVDNVEASPSPDRPAPKLISPEDKAVMDNGRRDGFDNLIWDFAWSDVLRAKSYRIYVNKIQQKTPNRYPLINNSTTAVSFRYELGSPNGGDLDRAGITDLSRWTWKVRAEYDEGWGDWSEERTFELEPLNTDSVQYPSLESSATASLQIDQANSVIDASNMVAWTPKYQSFTPTASQLKAVELVMGFDRSYLPTEGQDQIIKIRLGAFDGPVLGMSNFFIDRNRMIGSRRVIVPFMFSSPIPLIPGKVYVIEWAAGSRGAYPGWWASNLNPYPGGTAIWYTKWRGSTPVYNPITDTDFLFTTYY